MATPDLIDTTEMYLKTVFEMEEDGVIPMRARIVERLDHSGPTVSQTIGRMERQGLVSVRDDRRLELTPAGREHAEGVIRKHRLAEQLLISVIGLDWVRAHEEACRWEHVMSEAVEQKIADLLGNPDCDPYGNPLPGSGGVRNVAEMSGETAARNAGVGHAPLRATLTRIGEPLQAEQEALRALDDAGIRPGTDVWIQQGPNGFEIWPRTETNDSAGDNHGNSEEDSRTKVNEGVVLAPTLAPHLFVEIVGEQA